MPKAYNYVLYYKVSNSLVYATQCLPAKCTCHAAVGMTQGRQMGDDGNDVRSANDARSACLVHRIGSCEVENYSAGSPENLIELLLTAANQNSAVEFCSLKHFTIEFSL